MSLKLFLEWYTVYDSYCHLLFQVTLCYNFVVRLNFLPSIGYGLDHIFIGLGPAPHTPPSLHGLPAHTCVGTLPRWEPL